MVDDGAEDGDVRDALGWAGRDEVRGLDAGDGVDDIQPVDPVEAGKFFVIDTHNIRIQ